MQHSMSEITAVAERESLRKLYSLADYEQAMVLPVHVAEMLRTAMVGKENILVVGGCASGKTTLLDALLHALTEDMPDTRMLIVEDIRELQCSLRNVMFMPTDAVSDAESLNQALKQEQSERICVGEVRHGSVALGMLKAWNAGHPGGLCTLHANSAYRGLTRLDQLVGEVSLSSQRALIGETAQIVVFMALTATGRRVKEVIRVHGYDPVAQEFKHEMLYEYRGR